MKINTKVKEHAVDERNTLNTIFMLFFHTLVSVHSSNSHFVSSQTKWLRFSNIFMACDFKFIHFFAFLNLNHAFFLSQWDETNLNETIVISSHSKCVGCRSLFSLGTSYLIMMHKMSASVSWPLGYRKRYQFNNISSCYPNFAGTASSACFYCIITFHAQQNCVVTHFFRLIGTHVIDALFRYRQRQFVSFCRLPFAFYMVAMRIFFFQPSSHFSLSLVVQLNPHHRNTRSLRLRFTFIMWKLSGWLDFMSVVIW